MQISDDQQFVTVQPVSHNGKGHCKKYKNIQQKKQLNTTPLHSCLHEVIQVTVYSTFKHTKILAIFTLLNQFKNENHLTNQTILWQQKPSFNTAQHNPESVLSTSPPHNLFPQDPLSISSHLPSSHLPEVSSLKFRMSHLALKVLLS